MLAKIDIRHTGPSILLLALLQFCCYLTAAIPLKLATDAGASLQPNRTLQYALGDPPDSLALLPLFQSLDLGGDGGSLDISLEVTPYYGAKFITLDLEAQTLNWYTRNRSEATDYSLIVTADTGPQKFKISLELQVLLTKNGVETDPYSALQQT